MSALGSYKRQSLKAEWTRADMLVEIYDRAIVSLSACEQCHQQGDAAGYAQHFVDASKAIIAIHSGLKPEEHEVAFNVARLLHFVSVSLEKARYQDAIGVLLQVRDGFAAIAAEVNQLEQSGEIPPLPMSDAYQSIA